MNSGYGVLLNQTAFLPPADHRSAGCGGHRVPAAFVIYFVEAARQITSPLHICIDASAALLVGLWVPAVLVFCNQSSGPWVRSLWNIKKKKKKRVMWSGLEQCKRKCLWSWRRGFNEDGASDQLGPEGRAEDYRGNFRHSTSRCDPGEETGHVPFLTGSL